MRSNPFRKPPPPASAVPPKPVQPTPQAVVTWNEDLLSRLKLVFKADALGQQLIREIPAVMDPLIATQKRYWPENFAWHSRDLIPFMENLWMMTCYDLQKTHKDAEAQLEIIFDECQKKLLEGRG